MPYPNQTFSNINDLIAYINTNVVTNGNQEITAIVENNVENGLAQFIVSYTLNSSLAGISSSGGVVPLSKPITYFSVAPTSISLGTNVQNEFYIINATGTDIPLTSGYSYIDAYQTVQTSIPARSYVHLAKATTGSWLQVNTATASGGSLPPQVGKSGQVLTTNGTSSNWISPLIPIISSDFEPDGVTYINTNIPETQFKYEVFYNDLSRFLYEGTEWNYVAGGGIEILLPGFDANLNSYNLYLFLRGLNG